MAKVEFHFDFGSPNAYLAHLIIPQIEERTGAKFEYVPILLGGVFKLTNNSSPAQKMAGIKNRLAYEQLRDKTGRDLDRQKCVAIEDSRWGLESARGAGLRCVGVTNSYAADELAAAELSALELALKLA